LIAILDYGSGNLRSAQRAFELSGHDVVLTADRDVALAADGLVVPGVGAFAACMAQLESIDGVRLIRERADAGKAILGICVGMQVLFESGSEKGRHPGIGLLRGDVVPLIAPVLPHIGWNTVVPAEGSALFEGIESESFYFVHSYGVLGDDVSGDGVSGDGASSEGSSNTSNQVEARTFTEYGEKFLSAIEYGNICATQFHPEKSGKAGEALIKNWANSL
jgi:glutamine amidotransferase